MLRGWKHRFGAVHGKACRSRWTAWPEHLPSCAGSNGVPFARMDEMLKPHAKPFKRKDDPYAPGLRSTVLSTQQSEAAVAAALVSGDSVSPATLPEMLYTQMT